MESDWKLQKATRELQIASGTVLEAENLALSKSGVACSCSQQLEGVEEQLGLAREKVTSFEAASAKSAVQSKGELARL